MAFENKKHIGGEYEKIIFNPDRTETDMENILRKATNFKIKQSND